MGLPHPEIPVQMIVKGIWQKLLNLKTWEVSRGVFGGRISDNTSFEINSEVLSNQFLWLVRPMEAKP